MASFAETRLIAPRRISNQRSGFASRNGFHQGTEFNAVLQPDLRGSYFASSGRNAGGVLQFVPRKNRLQRDRRLRALMGDNIRIQRGNDFIGGTSLVAQIRHHFENFRHHSDPRFEAFGRAKIGERTGL